MSEINLTNTEVWMGVVVGMMRHIESIGSGRRMRGDTERDWGLDIEGSLGELALAKYLGKYHGGSLNTFTNEMDVADQWEVRTTKLENGRLIVGPKDSKDKPYVLVTGYCPNYRIRGWAWGREIMQEEYLHSYPNRKPLYYLPQNKLKKLTK
jgi:hypothetical protein